MGVQLFKLKLNTYLSSKKFLVSSHHQIYNNSILMEISGKIIWASEPRSGVSQRTGSAWKSQDFVIETHEQYPKRCVFGVFGEDRLKEFNIQVGEELTVSFDIDAHEYQGRWFNNLRAWRVQKGVVAAPQTEVNNVATQPMTAAPQAAPTNVQPMSSVPTSEGTDEDLPF